MQLANWANESMHRNKQVPCYHGYNRFQLHMLLKWGALCCHSSFGLLLLLPLQLAANLRVPMQQQRWMLGSSKLLSACPTSSCHPMCQHWQPALLSTGQHHCPQRGRLRQRSSGLPKTAASCVQNAALKHGRRHTAKVQLGSDTVYRSCARQMARLSLIIM